MTSRWRLISVLALAGAIAGTLFATQSSPRSEAKAVVVASEPGAGAASEDLAGLAEALLPTDAVLQPVIDELGLAGTPAELRGGDQLETEAVSNPLAVRIVGRASDPALAAVLAEAAARSLAAAAEERGLGTFEVFPGGVEQPPSAVAMTATWAGIGAGAGATAMLVGLVGFAAVRRPVLRLDDARKGAAAEAGFVVRMRGRRAAPGRRQIYPHGVLRTIGRVATADGRSAALVLIERRSDPGLRWVAGALASEVLESGRQHDVPVFRIRGGELEPLETDRPETLRVMGSVVALVSEGASRDAVRTYEEAMLALGSPLQRRVVVLVATARGRGVAVLPPRAALPARAIGRESATRAPEVERAIDTGVGRRTGVHDQREPPEIGDLLEELTDPDRKVRLEALRRLMDEPEPAAIDAVRAMLRDPDESVRGMAVSVLATLAARPRAR